MRRRWLKRLLLFLVLPFGLLAAGVWLLGWLALKQLTPEAIVLQLEATYNCRVRLEACTVSLFSSPARIELTGLQLSPRDADADAATPPAGRSNPELHATYVKVGHAVVEADLVGLLLRRALHVRQFVVEGADVKCDLLPGGENTLRTLFASPAVVKGLPNPGVVALAPVAAAAKAAATNPDEPAPPSDAATASSKAKSEGGVAGAPAVDRDDEPTRRFNVRELRLPSSLGRVAVVDSRFRFRNRKGRSVIELSHCTVELTDLAVDPANLAAANHATVSLKTRLLLDSQRKARNKPEVDSSRPGGDPPKRQDVRYLDLGLRMTGSLTPFDPATGALNPDLVFDTLLEKGSTVDSLPVLAKVQKNIDKARKAGLKMKDLTAKAALIHDTTLKLRLRANRLTLEEGNSLDFTDYALAMESGSFVDAGTETHEFRASLVSSQAVSDQALKGADEFLAPLGADAARELRSLLIDPLVKNGRVAVSFVSTGELDDPKVKIDHPLQDLKDQLEGAGRQLLDGLKQR